jgi:hypothetical protein
MNLEPDFRAPNSNDTVIAAAVVAFIIAGLVWAVSELFGGTSATHAAALADHLTTKQQSCFRQINEVPPKGCVMTQQASTEDAGASH